MADGRPPDGINDLLRRLGVPRPEETLRLAEFRRQYPRGYDPQPEDVGAELRQTLANIAAIRRAAGDGAPTPEPTPEPSLPRFRVIDGGRRD